MNDQIDDERPVSKQSCSLDIVEKKALPPIPCTPPSQGKARHHRNQVEQNTQTELNEFSVIGSSNNVTERKHRGSRKDAPNPLTGRVSPRKKRMGIKVEPNKKKHHCSLFDGPPPKPERRQPTGFFHPGLASIQGNINTFQPHAGVLKVPQNARKFMVKETKYRVDTVHGHRVPVSQELEFGPNHGQKQKWKRRLSPIKRRVDQSDEQLKKDDTVKTQRGPQKIENDDKDINTVNCEEATGESEDTPKVNCEENVDESEEKQTAQEGRCEINEMCEQSADDNALVKKNENVVDELRAEDGLNEEASMVPDQKEKSDNRLISRRNGDDFPITPSAFNNSDTVVARLVSAKSALIKDTVRELVESIVSRISPELSDNAEPNPFLFASSCDSPLGNKQFVSIAIQTDRKVLDSPLDDVCSRCNENGLVEKGIDEEHSTTMEGSLLGTSKADGRHQHGCVESYLTCDEVVDSSSAEIQATDDYRCCDTVHVTMSKGTMTPTMQGWRSLDDTSNQGQESPVAEEPTTPVANPPVPMAAQHILEVPGLGRMSMPFQAQHAIHSSAGTSDIDVVSGSISNSDEHLQGILIEDSAGDYTPAARTESQVSIFTLGHGDQRMGISTSLANIPSPQQDVGNDLANDSRCTESHASGVDSAEDAVQEFQPSTRPQNGDVQELIDNLIAERLNGVSEPETLKNEEVTTEENESPPGDVVQLFTLINDEVADHQCEIFRQDTLSRENHTEVSFNEETPKDTQPDDVKIVTETGETILAVKAEEGVDDKGDEYVKRCTDHELQDAFLAMEDAVAAAKLIIRYLGRTDARLRAALHRSGPGDDVVNCPAAERVAQEAHAFAVRTQSVFMTYFRLAEAEDTFREFILKEYPGSEKERRQLRRWWTINQPIIDEIPDESSDILEGEPEP